MHREGSIMRRLAEFARRRPYVNLVTKINGTASENFVELKPSLRRDRSILSHDAWKTIAKSLHISDRELEIIQGIFDDRKELAIADELKISMHTVHTHLERLYRKLGVSSRVALVLYILSEYLSSIPPTL
jgi:DNA-binding NarL/FixJ family response regulator